jgi:hypothetical protein
LGLLRWWRVMCPFGLIQFILINHEDSGSILLRNVGKHVAHCSMVVNVKTKLSLYMSRRHTGIGGVELKLHSFLTLALDASELSSLRPCRFIPWERTPSTNWIGRWVDPAAGLDVSVTSNIGVLQAPHLPNLPLIVARIGVYPLHSAPTASQKHLASYPSGQRCSFSRGKGRQSGTCFYAIYKLKWEDLHLNSPYIFTDGA